VNINKNTQVRKGLRGKQKQKQKTAEKSLLPVKSFQSYYSWTEIVKRIIAIQKDGTLCSENIKKKAYLSGSGHIF
jgi:hypothetical protein